MRARKSSAKPERAKGASLSALAKRLGVSPQAVSKAVKAGRLVASVTRRNGRLLVLDMDAAVAEWQAGVRVGPSKATSISEATLELTREKVLREQIANQKSLGALVPASEVTERWEALVLSARERLLSLPTKALQQGIVKGDEAEAKLVELVDEALAELSARGSEDAEQHYA